MWGGSEATTLKTSATSKELLGGVVEKRGPAERRGGNKKGPRGLIARSAAAIVQEPRPGATGSAR